MGVRSHKVKAPGSRVPGPRTSPTVKPLATMNKRNLRNWELRLGLLQVVALLGIVTGVMVGVFSLAFFTGHNVGFESAMDNSLTKDPRIPVADQDLNQGTTEIVSDVYAKLNDMTGQDIQVIDAEPELATIKSNEDSPAAESERVAMLEEAIEKDAEVKLVEQEKASLSVKKEKLEEVKVAAKAAEPKIVEEEAGIKIEAKETSVIVIDEDKPDAAKQATLDKLLESESKALETAPKKEPVVVAVVKPEEPAPVVKKVEPAQVAPIKTETTNIVQTSVPKGWYAQIAAPGQVSDANALANKLRASGFPVVIENATVRGKQYYRVLVGPESNKQMADRLLGQVKRETYIKSDPFLKVIR